MIIDNLIALRIIYLLVQPFEKTEAYKLGVIDENGNALLKVSEMNSQQKTNYTMLHRLVFRLKKVLGAIPFGKTRLASFAAAYLLVKESLNQNIELDNLENIYEDLVESMEKLDNLNESEYNILNVVNNLNVLEQFIEHLETISKQQLEEDAVTTTAGVASYETPLNRKSISRRAAILDVSPETFKKLKKGKQRNERWDTFLDLQAEENQKIRDYVKKNPSGILVVRCRESNQGQLIRYKRVMK